MKCSSSQSSVDSIFVKRMTMKNYTQNTYHETLSLCNACEYIAFGIVSHLRDGYVSVTMCKFSFFFFYRSLFHLASVLVSLFFFSSTNAFFSSFKQKKDLKDTIVFQFVNWVYCVCARNAHTVNQNSCYYTIYTSTYSIFSHSLQFRIELTRRKIRIG